MAKRTDGKLKILYVKEILEHELSEGKTITMRELLWKLSERGMPSERKSVADDIKLLRKYGLPIQCIRRGRATVYSMKKSP